MNRDRIRLKGNRYLLIPVLLMMPVMIFAHSAAFAGDTEAERIPDRKESAQETGEMVSQNSGPGEKDGQLRETEEAAGQNRESEGSASREAGEHGSAENRKQSPADGEQRESEEPAREGETPAPEGYYVVTLKDIHPDLPPEGRRYDGTDRISLQYTSQITREDDGEEEEIPAYKVVCDARLDGCDVGDRQVICSFALKTAYPDHIKLDTGQEYPSLSVEIKKAILRVAIPDGTKAYMDPPDTEHISLSGDGSVTVSGFAKDANGKEVVPEGFIPPQIMVDTQVLKQNSPMYRPGEEEDSGSQTGNGFADGSASGRRKVCRYEGALVLKKTPEGNITGNPTDNYEFCCDPEDDRYVPGCVTVTRRTVSQGEDYTLSGDEGAYLQQQDRIIVRQGTRLYANPVKGYGFNSGESSDPLSGEGTFAFRLRKKDKSGFVTADSEEEEIRYTADGAAPEPVLSVTGTKGSGEYLYCASSSSVSVQIPEDMSGIRAVRYRILRADLTSGNLALLRTSDGTGLLTAGAWTDSGTSLSAALSDEGIFRVEFEVTDGVGNRSQAASACIIVDHTGPSVTVDGVSDHSANSGKVIITAACSDAAYEPGSMSAVMAAEHGGLIPKMRLTEENSTGASVRFEDFKHSASADAVYTLTVRARDLAGNETVRTLSFSINRSGSLYSLGEETRENLKNYYHRQPFPVIFTETNLDEVPSAKVMIRRGTSLQELVPGDGLLSRRKTRNSDGFRYIYIISENAFQEDGRYEVILFTSDRAGNSSDSAARDIPVQFAIDKMPPQCLITGIRTGNRYQAESLTAVAEARDNVAVEGAWIYTDSVLYRTLDSETLEQTEGVIKLSFMEKKEWRTLQIRVQDCAGNEYWTPELTFLVVGKAGKNIAAPKRKRLSAEQISLICRWLRACCRKLRSLFLPGPEAGEMELIMRRNERGTPSAASAGGQSEGVAHISIACLQEKRLYRLLAAAGALLSVPMIWVLFHRPGKSGAALRRERSRYKHPEDPGRLHEAHEAEDDEAA